MARLLSRLRLLGLKSPVAPELFRNVFNIVQTGELAVQTRFRSIFPELPKPSIKQYTVIQSSGAGGPMLRTPVYAVFELGSQQFKVSPGDLVYTERLKGVDVGAKLRIDRIHATGSKSETLVGRPYVDGASVTAVVEEQVQDAKVTSFKKRRRKNSRRIKGHRQLLTGLRITGVNGILTPKNQSYRVVGGTSSQKSKTESENIA